MEDLDFLDHVDDPTESHEHPAGDPLWFLHAPDPFLRRFVLSLLLDRPTAHGRGPRGPRVAPPDRAGRS